MQRLNVRKHTVKASEFTKRAAAPQDARLTIKEPTCLYSEGKLVAIYDRPLATANTELDALKSHLTALHYEKNTRTGGLKTHSRIFGYSPKNAMRRKHYCGPTRMVAENEPILSSIEQLATVAAKRYREFAPDVYFRHISLAAKVAPAYRIGPTPFTSGIINRSNALKYHFDTGNFDAVLSCMFVFTEGKPTGGALILPEYDVKIECGDGSLFMFDGQKVIHGVTPINTAHGERYSIVFYSLKQMWKCQEITTELFKARKAERLQLRVKKR